MAQRPVFDFSKLSVAGRILLVAGLLLFIDLFLPWNRICDEGDCGQLLGWHGGLGVLLGVLLIALLVWEGARAANVQVPTGTVDPRLVSAILASLVTLFALLRSLIKPSFFLVGGINQFAFAWIGLVLGLFVGIGAYMALRESGIRWPATATEALTAPDRAPYSTLGSASPHRAPVGGQPGPGPSVPPPPSFETNPGVKFCGRCGASNVAENRFCEACGREFTK
jgi:hypothetical protein